MTIVDVLEQNSRSYGDEICLVEINPEVKEVRRVTWKEYELMEPNPMTHYRREISWRVFDEKANRFANLLLERGIRKGDKVAILLMNCLEWLPIYFTCRGNRRFHQQKQAFVFCGGALPFLCRGLRRADL